ncbi:uncharacterized protein LOC103715588 isoform X1 [Phoenix dactylifera]|uniref:Uncharacterized protein LOC103715588 isoform X1 n=1 Tax=Phoenix dactylifera TaxID=42345 RepID=A0A8B7CL90_PHODC|nr:uncharacterized protein LOC103715588 isoform X1 [Phoenix dactylifera]
MEAEGAPLPELAPLLEAASDFSSYPGFQNDASAKQFLDRYSLTVLFGVLQTKADVPGLEDTVVACLDRIFRTKYGASLLTNYAPFIQAGLQANSQTVRCLACKAVSYILQNTEDSAAVVQIIVGYNIYPLLINCLLEGNEQTSKASLDAITNIAQAPEGIGIIFPAHSAESMQLNNVAARSSSLARIRILALIAKLFSLSSSVATAVYNSNLLNLFEIEINNKHDMLTTLSALELLYELVSSPHSSSFVLKTTLLQLLTDIISNFSVDSILRSRAVLISGRLLSSADAYMTIDESRITTLLFAIDGRLKLLGGQNTDECESALEALGLIGATNQGAALLLTNPSVVARHVFESAFDRQSRGRQLAALHALGSICGVDRPQDNMLLNDKAEECLRRFIYATAAGSPKLTPFGLLLSVLQQEPELRLAGYRLISALVARSWCLREVCSKQEIITIVTDATIEDTKNGMEARHQCCTAISEALSTSNLLRDTHIAEIAGKLQEAVRRGPYLAKKHTEAQPLVITAERF